MKLASHKLLDDYFAWGGNFVDTADVYSAGKSEEIIGRWLKTRPTEAKQAVIATKGRFPMGPGPNDIGLSRRHLNQALDASLSRLGVEHIDLYQMHAWDALTPIEETLRFLDDAVSAGKIGYYGFSNYVGWHIAKAVEIAKARGYTRPVTLQPQYSLLVRDIELEIVAACQDAGMGLLPWSPLGGGWLTGKYRRDQMPTGATRLGENPNRGMESYAAAQCAGAHLGDHRYGGGDCQGPRRQHGAGGARLDGGTTCRNVCYPRGANERTACRQSRRGEAFLSDEEMTKLTEVSRPAGRPTTPTVSAAPTSGIERSKADGKAWSWRPEGMFGCRYRSEAHAASYRRRDATAQDRRSTPIVSPARADPRPVSTIVSSGVVAAVTKVEEPVDSTTATGTSNVPCPCRGDADMLRPDAGGDLAARLDLMVDGDLRALRCRDRSPGSCHLRRRPPG